MDRTTIIGILLGIIAVMGGNVFEGGKVSSILQPSAALIVFGGTLGATLLSFPARDIIKAALSLRDIFIDKKENPESYIEDIVRYAVMARKNGLIVLDQELPLIRNSYFRRVLMLAVDRMSAKTLREAIEQENLTYEEEKVRVARVFDTAGGVAPTIGILGAVLGLIQVMENLSEPSKLGAGIAVAFVATIYGVGSANLLLIPISKKLLNRMRDELSLREMILEGVIGIQTGMSPHYLREKLKGFIGDQGKVRA
ncbi:MAG: flagellar motor protein [Nitrospirales bacterium]|nr:flagellar motor protein [Nitrospirales bacterium]